MVIWSHELQDCCRGRILRNGCEGCDSGTIENTPTLDRSAKRPHDDIIDLGAVAGQETRCEISDDDQLSVCGLEQRPQARKDGQLGRLRPGHYDILLHSDCTPNDKRQRPFPRHDDAHGNA